MKQSEKRLLKSLVLSALMVASVATGVQAEDVQLGSTANASDNGIAIGNDVYNGTQNDGNNVSAHTENVSIGNRVWAISPANKYSVGIGSDVTYGSYAVAIGKDTTAASIYSVAIGYNAKANATAGDSGVAVGANSESGLLGTSLGTNAKTTRYGVALGYNAIANNDYSVALGTNSIVSRGTMSTSVTTASTTTASTKVVYADDAASDADKKAITSTVKGSLGAVSVGNSNATRQITNVAAGSAASDAVNVAQLKSVDNRLTAVNTELSGRIDSLGDRVDSVENQIQAIQVSGSGNAADISDLKETVASQGETIDEHTDQIKDLDDRVTDNTNSINDLDGRVTNNTNDIIDLNDRMNNQNTAISGLNTRVDHLGKQINKVGAGAAALAGLHPLDFEDDSKLTFAAGFGAYKNEQAAALGAFYRPNENLMFSFATAVGNSDNMYNAGLSFRFGDSSPYQGLSKAQLVSELEKQGEQLKTQAAEVASVKAENAALSARLEKLEALISAR
ncbi:YadA-like family protein [uncultured Veillonella sp.]|uniref:YadA-like family protein n=1 Tax=uncultured Veillonella sp. TaxID=159268 RepID=UPI0025F8D3E3|nr:YadA-like family protein [uncultured Veillonella sp.]